MLKDLSLKLNKFAQRIFFVESYQNYFLQFFNLKGVSRNDHPYFSLIRARFSLRFNIV